MATRRTSQALGSVRTVTLDDLKEIAPTGDEPIRVLVTVHSMKPMLGNIYVKGLGMWVGYIIQKYLKIRGIPHRLYMKSILTEGGVFRSNTSAETVVKFIKRNKIDYLIPSDVTDTMFVAEHYPKLAAVCKCAVTNDLTVYQKLEDKWETFNLMKEFGIPTPDTELFDAKMEQQDYPFFLKVASGTNAGRGVWHCKNDDDLQEALKDKETQKKGALLLRQTPTYGDIICAEIIYNYGKPLGFFFAKSVQADDLAGMGKGYVMSQTEEYKQMHSHVKVELEDAQWEAVTRIFHQVGEAMKYHGMIDIEFIIAGPDNLQAEEGSVWLLECNPRFSGDIHTTLSNPGFLDLYFDVLAGNVDDNTVCGNYSVGVDMKSKFGDFYPAQYYTEHPLQVLSIRHWNVDNYHIWKPKKVETGSVTSSLKDMFALPTFETTEDGTVAKDEDKD